MNFSYWERESFLGDIDFAVIGSGIVGLSTAFYLKKMHPRSQVTVFERGMLPTGASTRNAGFACFGSVSELIDDSNQMSEQELIELVSMRWNGLQNLKSIFGEKAIGLKMTGGVEFFSKHQEELFEECSDKINYFNRILEEAVGKNVFSEKKVDDYPFRGFEHAIYNPYEGQLDTGKLMKSLLEVCKSRGVKIFNGAQVSGFKDQGSRVRIKLEERTLYAKNVAVTTNAFAQELMHNVDVTPVRNQVMITREIPNLNWSGIFHIEKGYYYFRNVKNRILIGGGRHLFKDQESTDQFGLTEDLQENLEGILKKHVLPPNTEPKIDMRWSGILGVGSSRKVIIEQITPRIVCGVRLGGMGIAIGSLIGKKLAQHF